MPVDGTALIDALRVSMKLARMKRGPTLTQHQ